MAVSIKEALKKQCFYYIHNKPLKISDLEAFYDLSLQTISEKGSKRVWFCFNKVEKVS